MKAVILDGAESGDPAIEEVHRSIRSELEEGGWECESFALDTLNIAHCVGCFGCWMKTPGTCLVDDDARVIAREAIQCDLLILLSRVTYGGYSFPLKKTLERMIGLVTPWFTIVEGEVHHKPRYARFPRLAAVGVMRDYEVEQALLFIKLASRNALNMRAPAHSSIVAGEASYRQDISGFFATLIPKLEAVQ